MANVPSLGQDAQDIPQPVSHSATLRRRLFLSAFWEGEATSITGTLRRYAAATGFLLREKNNRFKSAAGFAGLNR
jgi:hypothetical protein